MSADIIKKLSIIEYPISEGLFKESLGTGEELKGLIAANIILASEEEEDLYYVNFEADEVRAALGEITDEEREMLHRNLIEGYYKERVAGSINEDYKHFIEGYRDYINLSYHYANINDKNSAIRCIFDIAKRLVHWGKGDLLILSLEEYSPEDLNHSNSLWREYYIAFCNLMCPHGELDSDGFVRLIQSLEDENPAADDQLLYFEAINLYGIYQKNILTDNEGAKAIFQGAIKKYRLIDNGDKGIAASYARILENMALCEIEDDIREAHRYQTEAEEIFEAGEDHYELAKAYYLKLVLLENHDEISMKDILEECRKMNDILEEYAFPDVERNYYNLVSDLELSYNNDFEQYLVLKTHVLTRDLVLYDENFIDDMYDILYSISELYIERNEAVADSLNILIDFFNEVDLVDEGYLFKGIKEALDNESSDSLQKIDDTGLMELGASYVRHLKSI